MVASLGLLCVLAQAILTITLWARSSSPCHRWGERGLEKLKKLPKSTQAELGHEPVETETCVHPVLHGHSSGRGVCCHRCVTVNREERLARALAQPNAE